jgi:streptogramin lyase
MKHVYIIRYSLTVFIFLFLLTIKPDAQITTIVGRPTYLGDLGSATNAGLNLPYGVAKDATGNVYIATAGDNRVRKINSSGVISTFAGNGVTGYAGDGGPATSASFNFRNGVPGIAVDNIGNVYIADYYNYRIRKITKATGVITTIAGGSSSTAGYPCAVAVDNTNNVYFLDNFHGIVREITNQSTGATSVIIPSTAGLTGAQGIAFDANNNLYIADVNNHVIRKYAGGTLTVFAGTLGSSSTSLPANGTVATSALLNKPTGISTDANGNVYIADIGLNAVFKVDNSTNKITKLAGTGTGGFSGDGGTATSAALNGPNALFVDASNNVFITDSKNDRIREITGTTINTYAGDGTDGFSFTTNQLKAQLRPQAVTIDPEKGMYIGDGYAYDVRIADPYGNAYAYVGAGDPDSVNAVGKGYSGDGGLAGVAAVHTNAPFGVAANPTDHAVYFADVFNNVIRKVDFSSSVISTYISTSAGLNQPYGVTLDASGNLYIADAGNNEIRKVAAGTQNVTTIAGTGTAGNTGDGSAATSATLNFPTDVAVDPSGNIFILDKKNLSIRKVDHSTSKISTFFTYKSHVLTGVAVDVSGNVYVSDSTSASILKITASGLNRYTVAGTGTAGYADNTAPLKGQLNNPRGLTVDASGYIYVADLGNSVIRKIIPGTLSALPVSFMAFTGQLQSGNALLNWSTATEINSNHFTVQRSLDAITYTDIATVAAAGNSSLQENYSYTDADIAALHATTVYYRLVETDNDGSTMYSNVIKLNIYSATTVGYSIAPNPVTDHFVVKGFSGNNNVMLVMTDMNGRKLKQERITSDNQPVYVTGIASGLYIVTIYDGKTIQSTKLVIK